jgi:hypothetical protein
MLIVYFIFTISAIIACFDVIIMLTFLDPKIDQKRSVFGLKIQINYTDMSINKSYNLCKI